MIFFFSLVQVSLPPQCSNYMLITDYTRNVSYRDVTDICDETFFNSTPTRVRFSGAAGTVLTNMAPTPYYYHCGSQSGGWYNGNYDFTVGETQTGTVCWAYGGPCDSSASI